MNRMLSAGLVVATLASVSGAHAADWDLSKTPTNGDEFMARFNAGVLKATSLGIKPDIRCWPDADNKGGHYCNTDWIRIDRNGVNATVLILGTSSDGSQSNIICAGTIGDNGLRTCNAQNGKEWVERWDPATKDWETTVTNRNEWSAASPAT